MINQGGDATHNKQVCQENGHEKLFMYEDGGGWASGIKNVLENWGRSILSWTVFR